MIKAVNLEKAFSSSGGTSGGTSKAVDNLDLEVRPGECFGLLGPNGAGKSTFIGMTYGTVLRSSGTLTVFGLDPSTRSREIKKRLGVVTQDNALDESLTVVENMSLYCAFIGVPRIERQNRVEQLLEYMNLGHKKDALIRTLSGGMKRRLVFVRALLGKPELLILDEPTTGLDPAVRHLLWGKVKELHKAGTTILLTTHYMHEAEMLCDRLVILNKGRVAAQGSPKEMISTHTPGYVGIFKAEDRLVLEKVVGSRADVQLHEDSSGLYVRMPEISELTTFHSVHGLMPQQIRPTNLEDVFLKMTGQELSVDA